MTAGDLAASVGLSVVPGTALAVSGNIPINIRGDELANHMVNGGHDQSKITGLATSLAGKSDVGHVHDDRYYTKGDGDNHYAKNGQQGGALQFNWSGGRLRAVVGVTDIGGLLNEADLSGVNSALAGKSNVGHTHSASEIGYSYSGLVGTYSGTTQYGWNNAMTALANTHWSSRRFKEQIEPAVVDVTKVLDLEPVTFRYRDDPAESGDIKRLKAFLHPDGTHLGLIAEDAEAAGLAGFVAYDPDGQPIGLDYSKLTVALLAVVKDQNTRIEALEARLETMS